MFKALDLRQQVDVISLLVDPAGRPVYHAKATRDELICPQCRQPVWFKAGEIKVYHFAHKDRGKCPLASESARLLHARAILFQFLHEKFGDQVTIEKRLDLPELLRAVDCFVQTRQERKIAYWLVEARSPDRHEIAASLLSQGIIVQWVFLADMMQRNDRPRNMLNLTPTERELMTQTSYDLLYEPEHPWLQGQSIHYLDPAQGVLTSFRAMTNIHATQEYSGRELSNPLAQMKLVPSTGEFVHPGEWERLVAYRQEQRRLAEAKRRQQAEAEARRDGRTRPTGRHCAGNRNGGRQ